MINKKAEDTKISPLIKMILVVLVVVIVFFGVFSFDMYKFFKNLPDFLGGSSPSEELYVDAIVYDIPVRILKNDGDGRCIVSDVSVFQGVNNDWLKSYGVREGELEINKKPVGTMEWITEDMIGDTRISFELLNSEKSAIEELKSIYGKKAASFSSLGMQDPSTYSPLNGPSDFGTKYVQAVNEYIINNKDLSLATFDNKGTAEEITNDFENIINSKSFLEKFGFGLIKADINGQEKYFFQSIEHDNFAVRGHEIYKFNGEEWIKLSEKEYSYLYSGEKLENQIIKQDLMKACYSEEEDFKETKILKKPVTLLLRDNDFGGDGKCVIYSSEQDNSLEHYSLKYNLFGALLKRVRLYKLNGDGHWENIEDKLPDKNKIEYLDLIRNLLNEEKEFGSYVQEFNYKIEPYSLHLDNTIKSIREGDVSNFDVFLGTTSKITFFKNDASGKTLESYSPVQLFANYDELRSKEGKHLRIGFEDDKTYLRYSKEDGFSVSDGAIYKLGQVTEGIIWKKTTEKWVKVEPETYKGSSGLLEEEWQELLRGIKIKNDLINECKK